MNEKRFRDYLLKTNHTENSINSRIAKVKKLEDIFKIDMDEIANRKEQVIKLLIKIRDTGIEDRRHTPFSNAVRKYYESITNDSIGRIF